MITVRFVMVNKIMAPWAILKHTLLNKWITEAFKKNLCFTLVSGLWFNSGIIIICYGCQFLLVTLQSKEDKIRLFKYDKYVVIFIPLMKWSATL